MARTTSVFQQEEPSELQLNATNAISWSGEVDVDGESCRRRRQCVASGGGEVDVNGESCRRRRQCVASGGGSGEVDVNGESCRRRRQCVAKGGGSGEVDVEGQSCRRRRQCVAKGGGSGEVDVEGQSCRRRRQCVATGSDYNKHVLDGDFEDTVYAPYFKKAATKQTDERCVGDGDCDDGLVCILQTCRTPPLSPWAINLADSPTGAYSLQEWRVYVQKMQIYHGRNMRDQKKILANLAMIEIMNRERNNQKKLLAKVSSKIGSIQAHAKAFQLQGNAGKADHNRRAQATLITIQAGIKRKFDALNEGLSIARPLLNEQAKIVSARRETLEERMVELESGAAKHRMQRSNRVEDLDAETLENLKKKKGKRGGLLEYEESDTERWVNEPVPGLDNTLFYVEGQYVLTAGVCPEGVCASAGGSISVALETTLYQGEGKRLYTTSKARVYGNAEGQFGCSLKASGCKLKVTATVGVSVEQELKYEHDLGNGVTMDSTLAVEAGLVAQADAQVGCNTVTGCKVQAKAFTGAYVKASAKERIGNDDFSGQVGGSAMVGAGAGASGDFEGNYDKGKITFGGEVCGMLIGGICLNAEVSVDIGPIEDNTEGFVADLDSLSQSGSDEIDEFIAEDIPVLLDHTEKAYQTTSKKIQEVEEIIEEIIEKPPRSEPVEKLVVVTELVTDPEKAKKTGEKVLTTLVEIFAPPVKNKEECVFPWFDC